VELGDKLIICAYAAVEESQVRDHRPKVVLVTDDNSIREVKDREQAASRV
jgi:aspartate 1-decarboxylase